MKNKENSSPKSKKFKAGLVDTVDFNPSVKIHVGETAKEDEVEENPKGKHLRPWDMRFWE